MQENHKWRVLKWKKTKEPCLAGGRELLEGFLVVHGRLWMVTKDGGVAGGGEKEVEREAGEGEEKKQGQKWFFANFSHWFHDTQGMESII